MMPFVLLLAACSAGSVSDPLSESDREIFRPTQTDAPFDLSEGASRSVTPDQLASSRESLSESVEEITRVWETDWSRATVDLGELAAGIRRNDPRDVIPPIDTPAFESVAAAGEWLGTDEPGALVQLDGEARFYPLAIMTRHEIVNDRFGDTPVAVTFCPLCNTALAFDRRVDGEVLRFGVSGLLRKSDLVMWDDQTTSLWQQITGESIAGDFAGTQLVRLNTSIVSFSQFADEFPDGRSLSQVTGFGILYGSNPYVGYSSQKAPIGSFFPGEPDDRFPALERVVSTSVNGSERAYPFSILSVEMVINDDVDGVPLVVWWSPGTTDALDASSIADSQAIGTGVSFDREIDGLTLTFSASSSGTFIDAETMSEWNIFGRAVAGDLAGSQLSAVPHRNEFWFAWAGFFPDGEVYQP